MMRMAVVADDLSGALASAGALAAQHGVAVPVVDRVPDAWSAWLVLNTGSRDHRLPAGRYQALVVPLLRQGVRLIDKRVDSALRGPVADELRWTAQLFADPPYVVAVPAYPSADRRTVGGVQHHRGEPVGRLADVMDAHGLALSLYGADRVRAVPASGATDWWAEGPAVYLLDIDDGADLQRAARSLARLTDERTEPVVLVSSGAILRYFPPARRHVVVVMGSGTAVNRAQVDQLGRATPCWVGSVWKAPSAALAPIRVLVSWEEDRPAGSRTDQALAQRVLEHLARWAEEGWRPGRIVASGGATAGALMRAARAEGVAVTRLVAPLVGLGQVCGGVLDGLELITKGGMVGDETLLTDLVTIGPG